MHFAEEEFFSSLIKYNNSSTPGPNKLLWRYLKIILKDSICLKNVISIENTCIELDHWPSHFKISSTIIIPKLNKTLYDSQRHLDLLSSWTYWVNSLKKPLAIDYSFM